MQISVKSNAWSHRFELVESLKVIEAKFRSFELRIVDGTARSYEPERRWEHTGQKIPHFVRNSSCVSHSTRVAFMRFLNG
jgi:hypothetical protein